MMSMVSLFEFWPKESDFINFRISSFCLEALATSTMSQDIVTWEYPLTLREGHKGFLKNLQSIHIHMTSNQGIFDFSYFDSFDSSFMDAERCSFTPLCDTLAINISDSRCFPSFACFSIELYHLEKGIIDKIFYIRHSRPPFSVLSNHRILLEMGVLHWQWLGRVLSQSHREEWDYWRRSQQYIQDRLAWFHDSRIHNSSLRSKREGLLYLGVEQVISHNSWWYSILWEWCVRFFRGVRWILVQYRDMYRGIHHTHYWQSGRTAWRRWLDPPTCLPWWPREIEKRKAHPHWHWQVHNISMRVISSRFHRQHRQDSMEWIHQYKCFWDLASPMGACSLNLRESGSLEIHHSSQLFLFFRSRKFLLQLLHSPHDQDCSDRAKAWVWVRGYSFVWNVDGASISYREGEEHILYTCHSRCYLLCIGPYSSRGSQHRSSYVPHRICESFFLVVGILDACGDSPRGWSIHRRAPLYWSYRKHTKSLQEYSWIWGLWWEKMKMYFFTYFV